MNKTILLLFSGFLLFHFSLIGQASFDRQTVEVGNLGLSITNVGTIGRPNVRNDPQGPPSMEYPLNSGIEHLFEAGLWIGATVNGQTLVSTASVDFPTGYSSGAPGFEFTAEVGGKIKQRSTLTNSDFFSFDAISHQDMLMDFSDKNVIIPGTTIPIANHNLPLGAQVHLETYAWNFSFADYFVIFEYNITNESNNTWDSVFLGMWSDLVVRNVNVATDGGVAFFNQSGGGLVDSFQALYQFDVTGDPGYTNSYGASQFLGIEWRDQFVHPNTRDTMINKGFPAPNLNTNFWIFRTFDGSQFGAPSNDVEMYEKMSKGLNFNDPFTRETIQAPNNRTQLLSYGPLISVEPGESFKYVIAFVAARQLSGTAQCPEGTSGKPGPDKDVFCAREELRDHLGWARRTFFGEDRNGNGVLDPGEDLNGDGILDRYILPEPPATPVVKIEAESQKIILYWDDKAESSIDPISKKKDFEGYRIYRTNVGDDKNPNLNSELNLIAQFDKKGNNIGFNNGFDAVRLSSPVQFEGDTTLYWYKMELDQVLNGWQYMFVISSFDSGDDELGIESLESSFKENTFRVWPGTPPSTDQEKNPIGVYPNPYSLNAAWDGSTSKTKKLYFYNLPPQCEITIYTSSGDVVAVLTHDSGTYDGTGSDWYNNFGGDPSQRILPGGEHAWDILSESKQSVSHGLYLYSVKDLNTGTNYTGRFAIIK
jgi:hypothetical protein